MAQKALIIFTTYNEKYNIEIIVHAVLPFDQRIQLLVVDDNCPLDTGQIVNRLT